ncbi:ATP-binding protein [Amycolatopsis sp. NPDC059657]|uniref:ATP-binding protein n=1 Tax=Amycolatopsis sp. NPDC059657 TaxID=3346899 RepID=UPI00367194DD
MTVVDLVGRARELDTIEAALDAVGDGTLTLITLSGDPGLGKTSLVQHAYGKARGLGLAVGYGTASELEKHTPMLAVGDALGEAVGAYDVLDPAAALDDDGALLRYQHYRRLAAMLDSGFLLCVDDVHWCDGASVEFMEHLLRRPPPAPGVLLCAWRPRQLSDRVAAALQAAHPRWSRRELVLNPLTEQETARLVPGGEAERLHELTEGNPLYLNALLSLGKGTWTSWDTGADAVRLAVGRELAGLPPEHAELVRTAAVLGDPMTMEDLIAVTGWQQQTVGSAVEKLIERDLLRPHHSRLNLLTFRHPLLRAHLYDTSKIEWRRQAHAKMADTLGKRGESAARQAAHVVHHALPGDVEAAELLYRAATEVLHTAPTSTISWSRAALRLISEGELTRRLSLLLGEALSLAGKPGAALEVLLRLRAESGEDVLFDVRVAMNCAFLYRVLGNYPQAMTVLDDKLTDAAPRLPADAPELADLHIELGTVLLMLGNPQRARAELRTALRIASAHPGAERRLAGYAALALADAYGGSATHRSRARAAELADELDDEAFGRSLDAIGKLGWAEALTDRPTDAIRHVTRGIRIARVAKQAMQLPYLLTCLSYVQLQLGRVPAALATAETTEETALALGDTQFQGMALALRANAVLEHQGAAQAALLSSRAMKLTEPRSWWGQVAGSILARIRLYQGLPGEALEILEPRRQAMASLPSCNGAQWMLTAAAASAALGDLEAARQWARDAQRSAEVFGSLLQRCHADLASAQILGQEGDLESAVSSATHAVRGFADYGAGVDEIQARLRLGELLMEQEDLAGASLQFATAKNSAAEHEANRLLQRAVDLERRLAARRPRPSTDALTDRERQLAELVGEGLSNTEISERLFLSRKTVEAHLSRIYRKLHIKSRSALATYVTQRKES